MSKRNEGSLVLSYNYEIRNKNGNILRKSRERRSHSFVKQFIQMLYVTSSGITSYAGVIDTSNTSRTLAYQRPSSPNPFSATIPTTASNATFSILVGTGSTAVALTDYTIQTLIAHGTGAGQLSYSSTVFGAPATDALGTSFRVTRDFTNSSGSTITINELGIVSQVSDSGDQNRLFLIIRDIASPAITVLNGQQLTINYNLKTLI